MSAAGEYGRRVLSPGSRVHRLVAGGGRTLCGQPVSMLYLEDRPGWRLSVFPSGEVWRCANHPTREYMFADDCPRCEDEFTAGRVILDERGSKSESEGV